MPAVPGETKPPEQWSEGSDGFRDRMLRLIFASFAGNGVEYCLIRWGGFRAVRGDVDVLVDRTSIQRAAAAIDSVASGQDVIRAFDATAGPNRFITLVGQRGGAAVHALHLHLQSEINESGRSFDLGFDARTNHRAPDGVAILPPIAGAIVELVHGIVGKQHFSPARWSTIRGVRETDEHELARLIKSRFGPSLGTRLLAAIASDTPAEALRTRPAMMAAGRRSAAWGSRFVDVVRRRLMPPGALTAVVFEAGVASEGTKSLLENVLTAVPRPWIVVTAVRRNCSSRLEGPHSWQGLALRALGVLARGGTVIVIVTDLSPSGSSAEIWPVWFRRALRTSRTSVVMVRQAEGAATVELLETRASAGSRPIRSFREDGRVATARLGDPLGWRVADYACSAR